MPRTPMPRASARRRTAAAMASRFSTVASISSAFFLVLENEVDCRVAVARNGFRGSGQFFNRRIRHAEIGLQSFLEVDQPLKPKCLNGANDRRIGGIGLKADLQRRFTENGMAVAVNIFGNGKQPWRKTVAALAQLLTETVCMSRP